MIFAEIYSIMINCFNTQFSAKEKTESWAVETYLYGHTSFYWPITTSLMSHF